MKIHTRFGYIQDADGHIISKYELPIGNHLLKDGYSFIEVVSKEELDKIDVYVSPLSSEEIKEKKIKNKMYVMAREQAIIKLKEEGEIE